MCLNPFQFLEFTNLSFVLDLWAHLSTAWKLPLSFFYLIIIFFIVLDFVIH